MPEVEYTTDVAAPIDEVWSFVKDMDNWAPFLTGYQSHEKLTEDDSIWVVKGELGGLVRKAEFKVTVTEWRGPESVTFVMEGLNEPVTGSGAFLARVLADNTGASSASIAPVPAASQRFPLFSWWDDFMRWLLRQVTKSANVEKAADSDAPKATQITFRLNLQAGGATGPVLNLLLAPMLKPVAEDFALKIAAAVQSAPR